VLVSDSSRRSPAVFGVVVFPKVVADIAFQDGLALQSPRQSCGLRGKLRGQVKKFASQLFRLDSSEVPGDDGHAELEGFYYILFQNIYVC